jgi:hypothetical protein
MRGLRLSERFRSVSNSGFSKNIAENGRKAGKILILKEVGDAREKQIFVISQNFEISPKNIFLLRSK